MISGKLVGQLAEAVWRAVRRVAICVLHPPQTVLIKPFFSKTYFYPLLNLPKIMAYIMVDIESDGPIPGDYSMISFGAVLVDEKLDKTFYGQLKPISDKFIPEALAVSGYSREQVFGFDDPELVMMDFKQWIDKICESRPIFISDNNGFDWMFICWYFHHFIGSNPFGFSSQNLGSLYKGMEKDMSKTFKHLRKTKYTHHPVDDAKGNAEALLTMKVELGLKIKF